MSHRLYKRELKSLGVCLSRNLCSLVLYESFVPLRVEEKNNPFIFSALPFGFYSNCYCDRGCYEEEYQCKQVNWSDDSEEGNAAQSQNLNLDRERDVYTYVDLYRSIYLSTPKSFM